MKRLIALVMIASALTVSAQAPWYKNWLKFGSDVSEARQLTAAVYPGYAPDLKIDGVSKPWGAGLALLYPVVGNDAVGSFVGGRLDYLGDQFWAPSATVGLKANLQLFGHTVTPFVHGGAIVPVSGAGSDNGEVGAIVGGGIRATVVSFWKDAEGNPKGTFDVFYATEHWTIFDGLIHRPGVALSVKF